MVDLLSTPYKSKELLQHLRMVQQFNLAAIQGGLNLAVELRTIPLTQMIANASVFEVAFECPARIRVSVNAAGPVLFQGITNALTATRGLKGGRDP